VVRGAMTEKKTKVLPVVQVPDEDYHHRVVQPESKIEAQPATRQLKKIEPFPFKALDYTLENLHDYIRETTYDRKDKKRLLIVRDISGIPTLVKKMKILGRTDKVRYGKKSFPFDMSAPTYRSRNTFYYVLDVDDGQMTLKNTLSPVSPNLLDIVMNRHVIKDLVSGLESTKFSELLLYILMALACGIPVGFIIGQNI
jgi:hypothetical protein